MDFVLPLYTFLMASGHGVLNPDHIANMIVSSLIHGLIYGVIFKVFNQMPLAFSVSIAVCIVGGIWLYAKRKHR
jgi:hypothetical protein